MRLPNIWQLRLPVFIALGTPSKTRSSRTIFEGDSTGVFERVNARRCFRFGTWLRNHPKPPTPRPLPCSQNVLPLELLLAAHSHSAEFEPPCLPARHRVTIPASAELPRLLKRFFSSVTSLGATGLQVVAICFGPFRAAIVAACAFRTALSEGRTYKLPLTHSQDSSQFGTVSDKNHWQAVSDSICPSRLSWLSYSPPVFSTGRRVPIRFPAGDLLRDSGLPTPARVERALQL